MSFGRPPSFTTFSAAPPDRGSFPLDHDGECSTFMKDYLTCLKENQNNNGKCRHLSKKYLSCRMDKGLMGQDAFKNLGFQDEEDDPSVRSASATSTMNSSKDIARGSETPSTAPSATLPDLISSAAKTPVADKK
ncbi:Cytochrome c oxidase assembly protein cox19 [Mortierella claussenii]|nr:Cytochrome c oxidase assembly protein cox19 [Mortierella claussenii]